ncbi:MAG TPA: immune inhibitor A domain-containing protein [bacterium]|nr:immune inhibitor A domain-containing protein [bacterium]
MRSGRILLAGFLVSCLLASGSAKGATLTIERPRPGAVPRQVRDQRAEKWLRPPLRDAASTRRLLRASQGKFPEAPLGRSQEVLRICAIRVEFASVPDSSKISGNGGRFDLTDKRSTVFIDPPPHNRKYFTKHMEALANYYRAMSYGQLEIQSEVFPLAENGAYVLPDIAKYNPDGRVGSWNWQNLEVFVRDAIKAADQDPDLKFSDFDAFLIFHAGSDWQNDLRGDSPYDLPSFFISLSESIAVDDSTYFVVDGSVVPETSSQDGYMNGINGVLAHEIGHQLGLPDLYDTQSGESVIGYWDLMDFGSGVGVVVSDPRTAEPYYVTGILPGSLSAWSKAYLGWVVPDTAGAAGDHVLKATELQGEAPNREALFVRMNSYEYFLVENRECDLDGDSTGILLADPSPDSTGVIMGPVNQAREFNYEYDWPLPGSGLLVWHVDDAMVRFGDPYDVVNGFPGRRGLTLAEADGIPDLGNYNSFYFLGSPNDPFFEGNNDRFADDTYPNTRSETGCHSHLVMDNISGPGLSMDFRVSNSWLKWGFPQALGDSLRFGVPSLMVTRLDSTLTGTHDNIIAALARGIWTDSIKVEGGDSVQVQYVEYHNAEVHGLGVSSEGKPEALAGWPRRLHGAHTREIVGADLGGDHKIETVVTDETGWLYAFQPDGSPYFENSDSLGAFARFEGMQGVPVAAEMPWNLGPKGEGLIVATKSGLYGLTGRSHASCDTAFSFAVPPTAGPVSQPVVADLVLDHSGREILWYVAGKVDVLSSDGESFRELYVGGPESAERAYLAVADLDRVSTNFLQSGLEIIVVTSDGWVVVINEDGVPLPGWNKRVCDGVVGPPVFADINGDGYLEVILTDRADQTRAFTWNGSHVEGWPQSWFGCGLAGWNTQYHVADTTLTVPSVVVADLGCGGRLGVFQGSLFEGIVGWEPGGKRFDGFPLTMGGGCSAIFLDDVDGDGNLDLITGGGDGNLYAYSVPLGAAICAGAPWKAAYFDRTRNCVYPIGLMPSPPVPGTDILVANTFHAFPNPVTGEAADFSFVTDTGGHATLEIFDIAGERVKRADFEAVAKVEKHVDLSSLGNGLYVCRLKVEGHGKSASDFFKLAIKR